MSTDGARLEKLVEACGVNERFIREDPELMAFLGSVAAAGDAALEYFRRLVKVIQVKGSWTGDHWLFRLCPRCAISCMTVGVTHLVYENVVYENVVCSCGTPEFDHLVEQLWHRDCFTAHVRAGES